MKRFAALLRGPWAPHFACAAVAVGMCLVFGLVHRSTADVRQAAFDPEASVEERLWCAHVAAMRAQERDPQLGDDLARALLDSGDPRLAEYALTMDLVRHYQGPPSGPPPLQAQYLSRAVRGPWSAHRLLATLFFQRKIGGGPFGRIERLDLDEAKWAFDAASSGEVPAGAKLDAHFRERRRRAREISAALRSATNRRHQ